MNLDILIENTFNKNNIPIITNFNYIDNDVVTKNGVKYLSLKEESFNQTYGNLIIINKWYLTKYGYFHILKHKWGYEHILLVTTYLQTSEYNNLVLLDLKKYINDGSDLHLHCNNNIDYKNCVENLRMGKEIIKTNKLNLSFKNNLHLHNINNNNIKKLVSIILPYYNRKTKIKTTLDSYLYFYKNNKNLEIVIVDDYSSQEHKLDKLIENYNGLNIKLIDLGNNNKKEKTQVNPCYPYNVGVRNSCGSIIILSSPETFHTSNMFNITNNFEKLNNKSYLLLSTFCSTNIVVTDNIIKNEFNIDKTTYNKLTNNLGEGYLPDGINIRPIFNNKYGSWYLHSEYNKSNLNFFSCITRNNYYKLCGFDEKYRFGTGFDDNEFLKRIKTIIPEDNFYYYNNANAIHIDHEIVHNLPPTTNINIFNGNIVYKNNNKWGILKKKIKIRIGLFCSFGIGGADKTTELLANYFNNNTTYEFIYFYNDYCFHVPKMYNYNKCRYINYNSYKLVYINNTEDLLNYDLDIFIVHRGGDEHWLLPNFENINFTFKIVEINFHSFNKTKCDYRICPTNEIFNLLKNSGMNIEKIIIIPNPIMSKDHNDNFRKELNIENKFVYGRLARSDFNIYSIINLKAYKQIENNNTIFLYINPNKQAIIDANKLNIKNIIFFEGTINTYTICKYYNTFDVFCHSNSLGETFGNTIGEAINFNKPVISHIGSKNWPQSHKLFFKGCDELFISDGDICTKYKEQMFKLKNDKKYYDKQRKIQKLNIYDFNIDNVCSKYSNFLFSILLS